MTTTYYVTEKDLTMDFLKSIKLLYKKQALAITIETEMDETEYLLSSEANRKHLEKAMKNVAKGKTTIVDIDKYLQK